MPQGLCTGKTDMGISPQILRISEARGNCRRFETKACSYIIHERGYMSTTRLLIGTGLAYGQRNTHLSQRSVLYYNRSALSMTSEANEFQLRGRPYLSSS